MQDFIFNFEEEIIFHGLYVTEASLKIKKTTKVSLKIVFYLKL